MLKRRGEGGRGEVGGERDKNREREGEGERERETEGERKNEREHICAFKVPAPIYPTCTCMSLCV